MAVAAPGYMAVIVDFPGLVAPSGQADPSTNGPGLPEVVWVLNSCGEGGGGDRSDARDRHEDTAGLVLARLSDELAAEFGGADANTAPGFQHRQHDGCKPILIGYQTPAAFAEVIAATGSSTAPVAQPRQTA